MFENTVTEREQQREAGQAALDWHRLYQWTVSQPQGAVLGKSCTNTDDPLCTYLGEVTGTRSWNWSVGPQTVRTGYHERLQTPEWVVQLFKETDSATGNTSGPVVRELYLSLLERVKPTGLVRYVVIRKDEDDTRTSVLGWVEVVYPPDHPTDAASRRESARILARRTVNTDVFMVQWEKASDAERRFATEKGDVTKQPGRA